MENEICVSELTSLRHENISLALKFHTSEPSFGIHSIKTSVVAKPVQIKRTQYMYMCMVVDDLPQHIVEMVSNNTSILSYSSFSFFLMLSPLGFLFFPALLNA
jgi:hypothetical protein